MKKHPKRLSLHKETLTRLEPARGGAGVGLAPTLLAVCRLSLPNCFETRVGCVESLVFTDCPAGCTDDFTNRCMP